MVATKKTKISFMQVGPAMAQQRKGAKNLHLCAVCAVQSAI
jgi:hypothetical protein